MHSIFSQEVAPKNNGQLDFFVENDPSDPDYIFLRDSIGRRVRVQLPQELNDAERFNIQINKKLLDRMFPNEQKIFDEKELLDESLGDIKKEELEKRGLNEAEENFDIPSNFEPQTPAREPVRPPRTTPRGPDAVREEPETEGIGDEPREEEESPEVEEVREEPKQPQQSQPQQSQPVNSYPYMPSSGGGYPSGGVVSVVINSQEKAQPQPPPRREEKKEAPKKDEPKYGGVSAGEDVSMLLYMANVAYYKKNYLRTLELLNRADYMHPYDARVKMMKGSLFYKIGWKDYAIRFWNEALVINPNLRILYYYVDRARREVEAKARQNANLNASGDGTGGVLGVN